MSATYLATYQKTELYPKGGDLCMEIITFPTMPGFIRILQLMLYPSVPFFIRHFDWGIQMNFV
jgi:hypothetical protein